MERRRGAGGLALLCAIAIASVAVGGCAFWPFPSCTGLEDAGHPSTDAGSPTTDAGHPPTDAGYPATDAGLDDSGSPIYPPSGCAEIHAAVPDAPSGVYAVPSTGAPDGSFDAYCDMERDDGGWTLIAKVHRFHGGPSADEPEGWLAMRLDPDSLLDAVSYEDRVPSLASHGREYLEPIAASAQLARFTLVAEDDPGQRATWFKELAPDMWKWFTLEDHAATLVCTDVAMTTGCSAGKIRSGTSIGWDLATTLEGMSLTAYGYSAGVGPLHMRLDVDDQSFYSAVCSWTFNWDGNAWHDDNDDHWGNGLEIWVR